MRPRPFVLALVGAALVLGTLPAVQAAPAEPFLFSRPALAPTVFPRVAELADLDGDGRAELVSAVGNSCCPTSIGISVMKARSGGSFDPAAVALTTSLPDDLEVLDVDGDGMLDAIAAVRIDNAQPGEYLAEALSGNGDGSFAESMSLPFPIFSAMAVGRFRTGGAISAVLATENGLARWDRTAGFSFATAGSLGTDVASQLLAADLDADGRDELLVFADGTLSLYRAFARVASRSVPGLTGLRAADFTGDGLPEVIATEYDGRVTVLDGALAPVKSFTAPMPATQSTVGDLDGDGKADVIRANESYGLTVFFGKGGTPLTVPLAQPATDVFVHDATGDGKADLLALETTSSVVEVLEGDGAGGFPGQRPIRATMPGHYLLERGDFNGDGKPDLLTAPWWAYLDGIGQGLKARTLLGDGNGGLTPSATLDIEGAVSGVGVADVNGDGKQDVVMSEY
ncbi:MAG TPA: VCBS repeat-containing protein, partial [Actinomycetota bacterium]